MGKRTLTITVTDDKVHVVLESDDDVREMNLLQPYEEKALKDMLVDFLRDQ